MKGSNIVDLLSIFFKKTYRLETFQKDIKSFGIVLKGKSVENLPKIATEFNDCFIVNNFDLEMEIVGDSLLNKNIVHFVCRTMTTPMTPDNYRKLNIKEIQLANSGVLELLVPTKSIIYKLDGTGSQAYTAENKRLPAVKLPVMVSLIKAIRHYQSLGLKTVFLPKDMINRSKDIYGAEFAKKFPNTGQLAMYYTIEIIKPKNLWVIGLDFYQADYLCREGRPHMATIELQRTKMKRMNAVKVVEDWITEHPEINFNIVTYYEGLKPQDNLKVFNYSQTREILK
jgi:hypothetical protein